jgi:alpha-ketoglutarate-dependent taurine dioxygenase
VYKRISAAMPVVDTVTDRPSPKVWITRESQHYKTWRARKLARMGDAQQPVNIVEIGDLGHPTPVEHDELTRQCAIGNAVFYAAKNRSDDPEKTRDDLRDFARVMGLRIAEKHRSAGRQGIVALQISTAQNQRGYIPYSRKPMNWHTDGYYNAADQRIRAMVLHCVRPAADGGVNQFLDPEIAYIRLRDENPDYIDALMHPGAMTIPENREKDGKLRPASVGPVFSVDADTGQLEMRYTARTRSISWRDDAMTARAVAFLSDLLASGDPYMQTLKMQAGQGVLCNNALHNRTGFDPDSSAGSDRLLFRIRFHNRVPKEMTNGQTE